MIFISTLRSHLTINTLLLSACTILSFYAYGWIIVALFANMTKALSRQAIGAIFAVSAILQYILQSTITKYIKVSFKWFAIALTIIQLAVGHLYYNGGEPFVGVYALLSVGTIGVMPYLSVINTYLYNGILHSVKQTFNTAAMYNGFVSKWVAFLVLCIFVAMGYASFKSGWNIHANTRVYNTAIQDDTNIVFQKYFTLLIYKLILLLFTKKLQQSPSDQEPTRSWIRDVVQGFMRGMLSQLVFVYFLFRSTRLYYQQIGKILLIVNCAIGLFSVIKTLSKSIIINITSAVGLIGLSAYLINYSIIELQSKILLNAVVYLGARLLQVFSAGSVKEQWIGRVSIGSVGGYAVAMILTGIIFALQQKSAVMANMIYLSAVVQIILTLVTSLISQSDANTSNQNARAQKFEGVQQIELQSTDRRL